MRKKINRKRFGLAVAFAVTANFMTACSERTVDYNMESDTADTEIRDKETGLKQFADAPTWKEEWTAVNSKGNNVTVQVEADVRLQDTDQMSVIEVKETEFDAALQKRVAECLFESGNIFYHDLAHLPKEELMEQRAELQELYDSYDLTTSDPDEKASIEDVSNEIQELDGVIKTAKESYIPAENYDVGEYLGAQGENAYVLSFFERQNDAGASTWKSVDLQPKDIRQVCPEELKEMGNIGYWAYSRNFGVDNQCEMTKEDAKKLADELVEKLDLGYTKYRYSTSIEWLGTDPENEVAENMYDGYIFYYDAGIGDLSFLESGIRDNYQNYDEKKKESEMEWYGMNARLSIWVNDKGIFGMKADNPIEITGVLENVELLSLSDIRDIIKESITKDFGSFRFKYTSEDYLVSFNEMALIYFRVRDKEHEGKYTYVPAWRLADVLRYDEDEVLVIDNFVLINAIDGSVIHIYDEV